MGLREEIKTRPWTVLVLVAWQVVAVVTATFRLFDSEGSLLFELGILLVTGFFVFGLWNGRQWAYRLFFALTMLCAAGVLFVISVQFLLFGTSAFREGILGVWGLRGLILCALGIAAPIFLLQHRKTKAFIGIEEGSGAKPTANLADGYQTVL